jgi:two-component system phosphate regulon sensor histidine kinase PhoR
MAGLVHGSDGHERGFRRIVFLLVWLVIVPTGLLLAVGILMLIFYEAEELNIVFGILVVTLVGCMVTGTVLSLVFLRREANVSKLQTDFVSKVSHELRTPLTSIRMFAEMLRTQPDQSQMDVCLEVLEKETIRLSDRIERLLDWGRMEAGRRIYSLEPESVETIVAAAIEAFDTVTMGRGVVIDVRLANGLPPVLADRGAMVDALLNLLANAWKYTGDDKTIRLVAEADDDAVRISVIDNGPGIATKDQRRVFEKFYRVDDRLSTEVDGSGLGLAIVRHVARGHGGKIVLESAPGEGSTFTIVIPRPKPDVALRPMTSAEATAT